VATPGHTAGRGVALSPQTGLSDQGGPGPGIQTAGRRAGPPRWTEPFQFPIGEGFHRTSPYGTRRSYNGGPVSSYHAGSDWGAPEGTPIIAPAPGVIVLAEPLFVRGGAVIIDHGAGVYSNFWHMSQIDVKPGDVVQTGDQLGLVGSTGLSTGAHLHWEIRVNGWRWIPCNGRSRRFPRNGVRFLL